MIATIPRMADYVGVGMAIAILLGVMAALIAGNVVNELDGTDNADVLGAAVLGAAVLAFLAVVALVIVGDCLLYAAAWTDYRRGAR